MSGPKCREARRRPRTLLAVVREIWLTASIAWLPTHRVICLAYGATAWAPPLFIDRLWGLPVFETPFEPCFVRSGRQNG